MSKVIRIDDSIADEINRLSKVMQINTVQASRLVFLGRFTRNGRPRKAWYQKTMPEARVDYGRRRLSRKIINVL